MQKLSNVATNDQLRKLKSIIFDSDSASEKQEQDDSLVNTKQDELSSCNKRKIFDRDIEDTEDEIDFEKMMLSHIFFLNPSVESDILYGCRCNTTSCESPSLLRRLFNNPKDLLTSLSGNEESNLILRYFKKEKNVVPRCLLDNIFLLCCQRRSSDNRSLQLAASSFLLMVVNQENRSYDSLRPTNWLLPPQVLHKYLQQLGADGTLCLEGERVAPAKRSNSLVVEWNLLWSLETLIKIVSLSFAPAVWKIRCIRIQQQQQVFKREGELVDLRDTISQTLRIVFLICVDAIVGKESLTYLCYPCVDNMLRVVSLFHQAFPDLELKRAVEEILQSFVASLEIGHFELAKLSFFLHGCGECFLWPYCHSLFHQRFIPSYYPSQLEDLDSTTSAATTTTTNAELDVIKNTDYSGDELVIIHAVAAAVAEMADPSSHCETEKTLAFFYTLLACIRVLKSKAVSRTPSSSSEAQWRSEDVESLSLNCQRFVYMTKRRRLSDEYVEQAQVVLECIIFYLGSIADYLKKGY